MGALIEINDTLKLKRGAGFPAYLQVGELYPFTIQGRRLYNTSPTRVFLVEEMADGLWNYVGHGLIISLTIDPVAETTSGTFKVTQIYHRDYALLMNKFEPPAGRTGYQGD